MYIIITVINTQIRSTLSRTDLTIVQSSYQVYTVPSVTVVVVFVTVDDSILPDNVVARIFNNLVGNNQATAITVFQPECKLHTYICVNSYIATYVRSNFIILVATPPISCSVLPTI